MDTDKVIQDLNRRFAALLPEFYQRRIIFWYDEDKEFEDKLDEVVLENAKVIALTGNNAFSMKKLLSPFLSLILTLLSLITLLFLAFRQSSATLSAQPRRLFLMQR